jgi:hypothetical protein
MVGIVGSGLALATALGVKVPHIVVHGSWRLCVDVLVEGLAAEEGDRALSA